MFGRELNLGYSFTYPIDTAHPDTPPKPTRETLRVYAQDLIGKAVDDSFYELTGPEKIDGRWEFKIMLHLFKPYTDKERAQLDAEDQYRKMGAAVIEQPRENKPKTCRPKPLGRTKCKLALEKLLNLMR